MKLLKLPLKILAIPVMLICFTGFVLVKVAGNISSYIITPLLLFILGCGAYTIFQHQWNGTLILGVMAFACFASLFCAVWVEFALKGVADALAHFLCS